MTKIIKISYFINTHLCFHVVMSLFFFFFLKGHSLQPIQQNCYFRLNKTYLNAQKLNTNTSLNKESLIQSRASSSLYINSSNHKQKLSQYAESKYNCI